MSKHEAVFQVGQIVHHKLFDYIGVVFDVDPEFDNTEEWYESIPEDVRPRKNQPFYHLLAETPDKSPYIAYVSEQNLVPDEDTNPIHHPAIAEYFDVRADGSFVARAKMN